MIVVSDTSAIINLAAVGQLELLRQLYGTVLIPPAVLTPRARCRRSQCAGQFDCKSSGKLAR